MTKDRRKYQKYTIGKYVTVKKTDLRIMAFAEGYYMARYKGCMPFVCNEQELEKRLKN